MYGQPWYSGYPSYPANAGYNPYIHPAYARPSPYEAPFRGPVPRPNNSMRALEAERARALAERRARRARYLPDEDDEMDDYDFWPTQWDSRQAELAAKARQEELERLQREEELRRQEQEELRQRQLEQLRRRQEEEALRRQEELKRLQEEAIKKQQEDERRRQAALLQQQKRREELARKYKEEQEARQRMIEEQKNLIRLRREEEARRMAAAEEERRSRLAQQQQRRAASRSRSRAPAQDDNSIPIHFHRPTSPAPGSQQKPASRPASPAPASPESTYTLEQKNEAASRIQKQFRIHRTYRKLAELREQFESLKKGFTFPHVIDFEKPGTEGAVLSVGAYRVPSDFDKEDVEPMQVDNVPEGKLAYTSTNYALHYYSDQLDKLLMKLDGIESYGEKDIREQRRASVKAIEKEASKLDRYCKQTWLDYVDKQSKASQPASESTPALPFTETAPVPEPTSEPAQIPITTSQDAQPSTETPTPTSTSAATAQTPRPPLNPPRQNPSPNLHRQPSTTTMHPSPEMQQDAAKQQEAFKRNLSKKERRKLRRRQQRHSHGIN